MGAAPTIFGQITDYLPKRQFRRLVSRYEGEKGVRRLSCWDQLLCMMFAQLTFRESLRDIETCLRAFGPKLYYAGIRGSVSRSTLAKANEGRDWRIFRDLGEHLIRTARRLYAKTDFGIELENTVYAFDSTTIDLSLSLFSWAHFMDHPLKRKAAVKLHTLMDLRGNIPTFIEISDGKLSDVAALDTLPLEAGSFYIPDRGYFDSRRLVRFQHAAAYFIIRARRDIKCTRVSKATTPADAAVRSDHVVRFTGSDAGRHYPLHLRRIRFHDAEEDRFLVFFTNNFELEASTVAALYKSRWQIELFFKWMKQNLRIKSFFGYSANAVKAQIWIAISTYVLIAIIKRRLDLPHQLSTLLQVFSVTLFEQMPILQAFHHSIPHENNERSTSQLDLFGI